MLSPNESRLRTGGWTVLCELGHHMLVPALVQGPSGMGHVGGAQREPVSPGPGADDPPGLLPLQGLSRAVYLSAGPQP